MQAIIKNLDKLPPEQRLSYLTSGVDEIVEKLREKLTLEALEEVKKQRSDHNPIKCSCGQSMYYQCDSKKNFITPNNK